MSSTVSASSTASRSRVPSDQGQKGRRTPTCRQGRSRWWRPRSRCSARRPRFRSSWMSGQTSMSPNDSSTGTSTCGGRGWRTTSGRGHGRSVRCETSWSAKASSRSRPRPSSHRLRRGPATCSCPRVCAKERSMRCPSHHSCSNSSSWSRASNGITRLPAATGMRTSGPTGRSNSPSSTSRVRSGARRTSSGPSRRSPTTSSRRSAASRSRFPSLV